MIINLYLAHLWLHSLSHLLLECLSIVGLTGLLTEFADSGLFDEVWQLEGDLVDATLVLEVAALLSPVSGDWN